MNFLSSTKYFRNICIFFLLFYFIHTFLRNEKYRKRGYKFSPSVWGNIEILKFALRRKWKSKKSHQFKSINTGAPEKNTTARIQTCRSSVADHINNAWMTDLCHVIARSPTSLIFYLCSSQSKISCSQQRYNYEQ